MTEHNKLLTSHLIIHIIGISGVCLFWNPQALWLTAIGIFICALLGVEVYLHRYLTHRAFKVSPTTEKLLNVCGILALQGAPILWAANHNNHHRFSDKKGDPHPAADALKTWFWIGTRNNAKISMTEIRTIKRLSSGLHKTTKENYYTIYWSIIIASMVIEPVVSLYLFVLPAIYTFHVSSFTNVVLHKFGYRNFETNDTSTNLPIPILLGTPYHNNHHADPSNYNNAVKWYEFDIVKYIIDFIKVRK